MNPTLYDILGVSRDASPEQIKAAWRDAAERFDPASGSSQFRLFNEAAEVLLDPKRRAEYDAQLAAEASDRTEAPREEPAPTEAPEEPHPAGTPGESPVTDAPVAPGARDETEKGPETSTAPWGVRVPTWALAGLAVVTAVAVGLAAFLWFQADEAEAVEQARLRAPSSAERAAVAVLSYDHERLEADRDGAAKYLTDKYRKEYVSTFDRLVKGPAKKTEAKVKAEVKASSVTRATPDRVDVLLYVNQVTRSTANNGKPQTALNRVRFEMVRSGDSWLVDGVQSY